MSWFTICIPSNRPLSQSRKSIESALAFAEARNGRVIVSDNSGDMMKPMMLKTASACLDYRVAEKNLPMLDNALNALLAVETPFVLFLGDDDILRVNDTARPFDPASLTDDIVGIKPDIEIWSETAGVLRHNTFTIDATDAAQRMMEYTQKVQGDNSSYYSFYRTSLVSDLMELMGRAHPTRAGFTDWAFVMSLVACGRMVHDPSTVLTYNLGRWSTSDGIQQAREELFTSAGLPPEAMHYEALFNFVDCYVMALRSTSPLSDMDRLKATYAAAIIYLRKFLAEVNINPVRYMQHTDFITFLREESQRPEADPDSLFPFALAVLDQIVPGISNGYIGFLNAARGQG